MTNICSSASIGYVKHTNFTTKEDIAGRLSHALGLNFGENCRRTPDGVKPDCGTISGDLDCLKNIPERLFDSPSCGNGFVESGEDCDCGLPAVCKNTCCDPNTCKMRPNVKCASGKCCDLTACRPNAGKNIIVFVI